MKRRSPLCRHIDDVKSPIADRIELHSVDNPEKVLDSAETSKVKQTEAR
jgi:hypothetical protein